MTNDLNNVTTAVRKLVTKNDGCTTTTYVNHDEKLHREDGPAFIREHDDGTKRESWLFDGSFHRYGGPSRILTYGSTEYHVHGKHVTDTVNAWLSERDYVWETMSDIEKWELDMFMRSL